QVSQRPLTQGLVIPVTSILTVQLHRYREQVGRLLIVPLSVSLHPPDIKARGILGSLALQQQLAPHRAERLRHLLLGNRRGRDASRDGTHRSSVNRKRVVGHHRHCPVTATAV